MASCISRGARQAKEAQMMSVLYDEYCYQDLIMNHPQRVTEELKHPNYDEIPKQIQTYATALFH